MSIKLCSTQVNKKNFFMSHDFCILRNLCLSRFAEIFFCLLCFLPENSVVVALTFQFSSVQFSRWVVSNSLQPSEPQHARPHCPSPTPGVYPNTCPLSQWCHPTISSSVIPFSSHLQSFPASGSFQRTQLFASGGQSIGVSASTSVLPMNTQDLSPLGWTSLISL